MYKIGMYGGSFNPIHLGHINNIIEASTMCEKLFIILSYSEQRKEIPHKERFMWLKQITNNIENVEVIEIEDKDTSKENYNWEKGAEDIKNAIKEKINIVFCGSDYQGSNHFEKLYEESKIYYFDRNKINISSTEIRKNPYKYYEFIPKEVRPFYTKKIAIIGTESCGKSTLVRNLAKIYNTNYVEEIGRNISDKAGGINNMQTKHFTEILYRHKVNELEALKSANKVLFIDTDSIITLYYYELLFDRTNEYNPSIKTLAHSISNLNNYDLYLFLEPDVKWVQDGTRTYGDDEVRKKNNETLKKIFNKQKIKYECISGDYHQRFIKIKQLINQLIEK